MRSAFYSCFINCKRWTGMLLVWKQAEPCWALKVYDVCELFAQWLFGDCRRPSKRQRETNTSVLHHHCCWSRLQVRASTVQSLAVLSLHEWHTLYYKCTSVWSSISTLSLVCSLVLTSAESLVVRKLIGSLICYHYTTIYYSAVASNLLRLAISRAILSDQPELVLWYLTTISLLT